MRLISSEDLYKRLTELRDRYKDSNEIVDMSIAVGLERDHRSCFITNASI